MRLEYQIGARWNKVQSYELLKYGIVVNEEEFSYIVINELLYDSVKHIFED